MMDTLEVLKLFNRHRGDAIVIPGRGGRLWVDMTTRPGLDLALGDPAMGGHAAFAFGVAMAVPERKVVLFDSEGDLQMGLGILFSIAEQCPRNFYHFMLDNECYATTGGQPVPNAKRAAYDAIASGAGYPRAFAFDEFDRFAQRLPDILAEPGPVFVALKVLPNVQNKPIGQRPKWMTRTRDQQIRDLQRELGIASC
jgi:pyruvate/2-oxoacid:ferredoxin oxidoreductase beta subunit